MSITIVNTWAGTTSNSYEDVTGADAYFERYPGFNTLWAAMTTAVKNAWLVSSAEAIDHYQFIGAKYLYNQSMQYPRDEWALDDEETDTVHVRIKRAQCQMIMYLYKQGGPEDIPERDKRRVRVDGVTEVEWVDMYKTESNMAVGGTLESVEEYLSPWLAKGGVAGNTFPLIK